MSVTEGYVSLILIEAIELLDHIQVLISYFQLQIIFVEKVLNWSSMYKHAESTYGDVSSIMKSTCAHTRAQKWQNIFFD